MVNVSENRKRRWDSINSILDAKAQKSEKKDKSSLSFSRISWDELSLVFPKLEELVVDRVLIPPEILDRLHEQLLVIHRLFGNVLSGKEAKRLQFISPIFISVCQLLPPVTISVEEDMKGAYVHANGRFEFVIEYNGKKVCIVEAKKDDMIQGQVQSLLGCEVVAEIENKSTVYAIVTSYTNWMFFKSTDDSVSCCVETLQLMNGMPSKESVARVASVIYGILTNIEGHESAADSTAAAQNGDQKVGST